MLISNRRNRLGDDIICAVECLQSWDKVKIVVMEVMKLQGMLASLERQDVKDLTVMRILESIFCMCQSLAAGGWKWRTLLHYASKNGNEAVARLLICNGASVFAADRYYYTPLHLACENGHEEMARLLIGNNAFVSAINRKWQTPQHLASMNGHKAVARLLNENGAFMSL